MKENFIGASNLPFSAAPPPVNERGTAVWWEWPQRKRRGLCGSIFLRDGFQTAAERRIWSGTGEREAFFLKPRSAFPIVADLCRKCKAQFSVKTDRCGYRADSVHYIIFLSILQEISARKHDFRKENSVTVLTILMTYGIIKLFRYAFPKKLSK
jgi:hypothetical protein